MSCGWSIATAAWGAWRRPTRRGWTRWRRSDPEVSRFGRQELAHDNGRRGRSHHLARILTHWETRAAHGRRRRPSHLGRTWRAVCHGFQFAGMRRRHEGMPAERLKNHTRQSGDAHHHHESNAVTHVSYDLILVVVRYVAHKTTMSLEICVHGTGKLGHRQVVCGIENAANSTSVCCSFIACNATLALKPDP